jgi:predicted nucleic acid-binding protein
MIDKFFLDANILVYCFDNSQPEKKNRSLKLVAEALQTGNGMISTRIVQEFLDVATRKFAIPMKTEDAKMYLEKVLNPLCQVFPDLELYQIALDIQKDSGDSFYDSLILSGAILGGCTIL